MAPKKEVKKNVSDGEEYGSDDYKKKRDRNNQVAKTQDNHHNIAVPEGKNSNRAPGALLSALPALGLLLLAPAAWLPRAGGVADPAPAPAPAPVPANAPAPTAAPPCKLSEYACTNKRCVPANRYCDNVNDCGDSSDEPRHCTPCNRTYYGDLGRTYDLELHRPKEDRLPFICHITLTAGGGVHGDLIQLTLDSFTLGRFVSFTAEGCPDGALQIGELGRPLVGGSWCGTSWGPAVYYSETRSITLTVKLLRLSKDQTGYNFDFRMEYKVLRRELATVRYGGVEPISDNNIPYAPAGSFNRSREGPDPRPPRQEYYLGDLISGTYCSRIFSDCDRKVCRLQSPNFPGVYPRNLTCYYAVRQHEVPPGKHALITVKQKKGQLISIRSQSALYAPTQQQQQTNTHVRTLKVWTECDDVQDYVTIYDGYTTRDPVILKFCGGGEAVPEAVSSGPELLVEFTTSPYGTFLHPAPIQSLHGFQLEVEVKFVDQQSPTYARNKRACEFWLRGTGKGVLESPQHSLTPNTTCLYHLQGIDTSVPSSPGPMRPLAPYPWRRSGFTYPPPRFRVWLSVLKFHVTSALGPQLPEEEICASHLNVWDGPLRIAPGCSDIFCDREKWKATRTGSLDQPVTVGKPPGNATILARYCRDRVPRSCDHSLLGTHGSQSAVQSSSRGRGSHADHNAYGERSPSNYKTFEKQGYQDNSFGGNQFDTRGSSHGQNPYGGHNALNDYTQKGRGIDVRLSQEDRGYPGPTMAPRLPRPCALAESFLSTGDSMTLELRLADSTALKPVSFKALYEFVDLQQDGEAFGPGPCSRRFFSRSTDATSEPPQRFTAPRDIFLYGRGGAQNLSCSYRFEAQRGERVKIMITSLTVEKKKRSRCLTHDSARTSRKACLGRRRASLTVYEVPWPGSSAVPRDCLCSVPKGLLPFSFISATHVVEVRFEAFNMSASDDFSNMFFEGTYEFIRSPVCPRTQRVTGASGEIKLGLPSINEDELNCIHHPWLIDPSIGHYLYVQMKGTYMNEPVIDEHNFSNNISILHEDKDHCSTKNRIAIYPGTLPPVIVCPSPPPHQKHSIIKVFSEGWGVGSNSLDLPTLTSIPTIDKLGQDFSRAIAVELIGKESGTYSITWLELSRRKHNTYPAVFAMLDVCKFRCPELNACINASLWCDGISHCPSGYDEALSHCSFLLQLPLQYLLAFCAAIISGASLTVFILLRIRKRRRSSAFQRRLESLSSDTAVFGDKEVIC